MKPGFPTVTFPKSAISSPPGVLVEGLSHFVLEPCRASWMPEMTGKRAPDDDRFLNGGILIWHIDDQIIRERIQDNAINHNPDQKGCAPG